jgi:hypothetical protein
MAGLLLAEYEMDPFTWKVPFSKALVPQAQK